MRFAAPLVLLCLVFAPLTILGHVLLERARARRLAAAGDDELITNLLGLGPDRGRGRRLAQTVLFTLALALVTVALARPQFGLRTETRRARGMDVVVVLDLSRSMLAEDLAPNRLERAKLELGGLIERLGSDRVGLVGFTSVAVPLCPLTTDRGALLAKLRSASPDDLPRGGTAIAGALAEARRMLEASPHKDTGKAIVVVTDGEGHEGDPEKLAGEARAAGVEVHVVGVGSAAGEPIPLVDASGAVTGYVKDRAGQTVISRLDADTIAKLASAGGGIAALPTSDGGIDLSGIAGRLLEQKRIDLEARTVKIYEERYRVALLPAFVLLLAASLVGPRRRLPRIALGALLMIGAQTDPALANPLERTEPSVAAGNTALAEGRAADALTAYDEAKKALGDDPRLRLNRGLAKVKAGELGEAAAELEAAAAHAKDPAVRAEALFALGNTQRALKKLDLAIDAYRRALIERPGHPGARRNLELTRAMKRIQALQPKDPNAPKEESNDPKQDSPDAGTDDAGSPPDGGDRGQDAGVGDAGGHGEDGGGERGPPDAGTGRGDGGDRGSPDGGATGGADAGAGDAGAAPPPSPAEPKDGDDEAPTDVEQILDALEDQTEAAERRRLKKQVGHGPVEKDW